MSSSNVKNMSSLIDHTILFTHLVGYFYEAHIWFWTVWWHM